MKIMEPPTCRLCEKKHWARDGCAINPLNTQRGVEVGVGRAGADGAHLEPVARRRAAGTHTRRGDRRVLKAEAARPEATRSRATAKETPPPAMPGRIAGKNRQSSRAAKPSPGKRKPPTKRKA